MGRVQTPTLAIVFNRELEIRDFEPRDYWRVTAKFQIAQGTYEGVYQKPNFRKSEEDEHDRVDRVWDRTVAEKCWLPVGANQSQKFRRKKILQPNIAAAL